MSRKREYRKRAKEKRQYEPSSEAARDCELERRNNQRLAEYYKRASQ